MKTQTLIIVAVLAVIGVLVIHIMRRLDKGIEIKHGLDLSNIF